MPSRPPPLSPHLQIYRFTLLMASSILHRMTGVALYGSVAGLALWLLALNGGPETYDSFLYYALSWPALAALFILSWIFFHHMMGGLRHLVWDTGKGLDVPTAHKIAVATYILSFAMTGMLWWCVAGGARS